MNYENKAGVYARQKVEISSEAATGGVLQKRFSKEIRKFHSKAPVLESLFNNLQAFRPRSVQHQEHLF